MLDQFVIFDTEYTTWDGAFQRAWSGDGEYREIVQIGAIRVKSDTLEEIDSFNILTRPIKNPQLSDYFQNLTGVTQDQLDNQGIDYPTGVQKFSEFCDGKLCLSYGNDLVIMAESGAYHRLFDWTLTRLWCISIIPYIRQFDSTTKGVNSGSLAKHFGLVKDTGGQDHDALYDCRSILMALRHMRENGAILPF